MTLEGRHYANFDVAYAHTTGWSWTCWEPECHETRYDFPTYSDALDDAYHHFDRAHGEEA